MADKSEGVVHVPETPGGVPATPKTVEEFRQEQVAEWGTYVATTPIFIEGIRAFNVGDAVPVSHIDRGVVSTEQVAKRTTKAGQAATQPSS
jgi:hypothetical protein